MAGLRHAAPSRRPFFAQSAKRRPGRGERTHRVVSLDNFCAIGSMSDSSGVRKNFKGNLVQIGDGPAAVTGDERCKNVTDAYVGKTQPVE